MRVLGALRETTLVRRFMVAVALIALVTLSGCGDKGPKVYVVKGKLTKGGQPFGNVTITLAPWTGTEPGPGPEGSAPVAADGTFRIRTGSEGRDGLPPGQYKVYLAGKQDTPDFAPGATPSMGGATAGARGTTAPTIAEDFPPDWKSPRTSPKTVEVKAEENDLTIDVPAAGAPAGG